MISMTGYGRATAESSSLRVEVSLRSVNHRYLDSVVRLPQSYRGLEAEIRARLGEMLGRGRVEVHVEVTLLKQPEARVRLDAGLAAKVLQELEKLPEFDRARVEARDVLAIPEAWIIERETEAPVTGVRDLLLECLDRAIDELIVARSQEGRSLFSSLKTSLDELSALVTSLSAQRQAVSSGVLARLSRRLEEVIAGSGIDPSAFDPGRLEQEAALLAEKSDVAEELDRLKGHVDHFANALGASEPVGRRLDFLAQEIGRELNTLAAKCRDLEMARLVIDAKVYCERLREQAQNVE